MEKKKYKFVVELELDEAKIPDIKAVAFALHHAAMSAGNTNMNGTTFFDDSDPYLEEWQDKHGHIFGRMECVHEPFDSTSKFLPTSKVWITGPGAHDGDTGRRQ